MKRAKPKKEYIEGLNKLADAIADHFKLLCDRKTLHYWRTLDPPFPRSVKSNVNRFDKRACFDWVEANVMSKRGGGDESQMVLSQLALKAKQEQIIRENEEHKFKFDVEKKKYIDRSEAERTIVGMSRKIFSWVRGELERSATKDRKDKLVELGASPEIIAAFHAFDLEHAQRMVDAISAAADKNAQEASDGLSA